jgi:hypothetical protein
MGKHRFANFFNLKEREHFVDPETESYIIRSLLICSPQQTLSQQVNKDECGHVARMGSEVHTNL